MNKVFASLLLFTSFLQASEPIYSFLNVSINYLDWNEQTEQTTTQKDFFYIGAEGGVGYSWGELYANASLENPMNEYDREDNHNLRYTLFADFDIKLQDEFRLHFQNYHLESSSFFVNDFVAGFSYKYIDGNKFWIKPFLGVHYTNDTYFDGVNGYMGGWVFNYNFGLFHESFSLAQWNEIEFERAKDFYLTEDNQETGDSKSYGLNGALTFWWNINKEFTTGVQYRYADNKLGFENYQSAFIYTMKYNFK